MRRLVLSHKNVYKYVIRFRSLKRLQILIANNEAVVYEYGACIYLGYFNAFL